MRIRLLFAGTALLLAAPSTASAETLTAPDPVLRECAARALPAGAPGAATASWTAPAAGLLTARLDAGPDPDWDLALLRGGRPAGASTSFGSRELATISVRPGDQVVAQACRRSGGNENAELELDLFETAGIDPAAGRASLESVPIGGPGDVERLEQLGLDVTHDVSPEAATIVLHDAGERALLDSAGFTSTPLIEDLAANDRAERRAEDRAALAPRVSALPTGRETYRVYEDFTTELKALAEANPALVRPVTDGNGDPGLGLSFEGRPIEGIEIAADVNRADDGRPVYMNLGTHHAREWPSGEFPMELAHNLVQGFNSSDPRIVGLLESVRVVIVPVVNPDGFVASRSFGTSPLDDDPDATLPQALANQAAYIRKNCRPTDPGQAALPCAMRTGSGVDLNRNYGYYWGGPGASTNTTTQGYRGTGPFSEPEAQAVHEFSSRVHPTVFISNHTFTDTGWWLRQPGFDAAFLPQDAGGSITPDEPAMKALGDAMGDTGVDDPALGATGWPSDLGWELGDITGATEDWNYFAQGSYGYTPEARGPNFHGTYANMVVTEYVGDAQHAGEGVREAFLLAGEEAGETDNHGVLQGTVPPGATLTLSKAFEAPTWDQPLLNVDEELETTMAGPADGTYEWHVMPSDRPQISGGPAPDPGDEEWTMTCQRPGNPTVFTAPVEVARGQNVVVDWGAACGADAPGNDSPVAGFDPVPAAPLTGQQVNLFSTSTDPDGAIAQTEWDLDGDGAYDDASGLVASRVFATAGNHEVGVEVTDNEGATDTDRRTIVVSDPPPLPPDQPPAAARRCGGLEATITGTGKGERLRGTPGADVIVSLAGADRVFGRGGEDVICGGGGTDRLSGGGGADRLLGQTGPDSLFGGGGEDSCRGGRGRDRLRSCP